ncbi:MAG: uracil-DNA glycosylase [Desulfobacteraceae bacterium]|nr:uracil-DNA glycosylase [Desulfobacteraceae bacterium]
MSDRKIQNTLDEIVNTLEFMKTLGVAGVDCSSDILEVVKSWDRKPATEGQTLASVQQAYQDCRRCALSKNRSAIVFGEGDPHADLVFVGEAPGEQEDLQGRPFVGPAGELLTKIISAMKLTRESVYICNIVKCRPPSNRNPLPIEIESCSPILKRQIDLIRPKVICALGGFAARTLLSTDNSITMLRGRFHRYQGIRLMPTYHPAHLLRHPEKKRDVWEDIKKIMAELGATP